MLSAALARWTSEENKKLLEITKKFLKMHSWTSFTRSHLQNYYLKSFTKLRFT